MSSTAATADPLAGADPPEFVIGFPADFRDLPLASEPKTWDATAAAFLDLVDVERPPEYRELALAHLRAYSALLATGGVVKAVACLGSSDGKLSTASVLVSWLPAPPAVPADIAAMGLFAALSERHDDREVYAIELPVGPAVAVIAERWLNGQAPGLGVLPDHNGRHLSQHPLPRSGGPGRLMSSRRHADSRSSSGRRWACRYWRR